jgi:ABC-type transport system substrate-binding protein
MDYPLIQDFLQPLYYTGASSNDSHFSNADFDKLVDQANAESDTTKAVGLFQDAEKILAEQVPAIPLWYQNGSAGWSDKLSNVALDPFSVPVYNEIKVSS